MPLQHSAISLAASEDRSFKRTHSWRKVSAGVAKSTSSMTGHFMITAMISNSSPQFGPCSIVSAVRRHLKPGSDHLEPVSGQHPLLAGSCRPQTAAVVIDDRGCDRLSLVPTTSRAPRPVDWTSMFAEFARMATLCGRADARDARAGRWHRDHRRKGQPAALVDLDDLDVPARRRRATSQADHRCLRSAKFVGAALLDLRKRTNLHGKPARRRRSGFLSSCQVTGFGSKAHQSARKVRLPHAAKGQWRLQAKQHLMQKVPDGRPGRRKALP